MLRMKIRFKGLYEFIHCKIFKNRCSKCNGELELIGFDPDIMNEIYQCKECGYKMF